eukprot:scaffold51_cov172-Ochromonas_danica.AAC.16
MMCGRKVMVLVGNRVGGKDKLRVRREDGEEEGEKEKASLLNEKHHDGDDYNSEESEEDLYNLHNQRSVEVSHLRIEGDLWSEASISLSSHSDYSSISSGRIDNTPPWIDTSDGEDSCSSYSTSDIATRPCYKGLAKLLSDSEMSESKSGSISSSSSCEDEN